MIETVPPLPHNIMACSGTALLLPTYATVLLKTRGGSVYWFSVKAGHLQIVDLTLEAHHDRCSTDHVFSSDFSFRFLFFLQPLHVMQGHCLVRVRDCFVHGAESTCKCGCQQWRTQEFCLGGVQQIQLRTEDRENGDPGGGSPLVRGSGGSCNLVQEISFRIVKFSQFLVLPTIYGENQFICHC